MRTVCKECGYILKTDIVKNEISKEKELCIEPCQDCLKREYDSGEQEGYDRGLEDAERGKE